MPNRIIKESICTSESIDQLSWFDEVFFYRLIVNCDDYGRFDARLAILKARLFPLKAVTEKQIGETLNKLSTVGIVTVYEYDGRPFLQLATWDLHQQIRAKRSKYPQPVSSDINRNHLISDDIKCPRNPIQSNPNPNPNPNTNPNTNTNTPTHKNSQQGKVQFTDHVSMTNAEREKLISTYGEVNTARMIEKLDNYKGSSGKKYKDDYRAILNWVKDEILSKKTNSEFSVLQEIYDEELLKNESP